MARRRAAVCRQSARGAACAEAISVGQVDRCAAACSAGSANRSLATCGGSAGCGDKTGIGPGGPAATAATATGRIGAGGAARIPPGFGPAAATEVRTERGSCANRVCPTSPRIAASATLMLSSLMILTRTGAVPALSNPSSCAARRDRSMIRSPANGPRSLTRTLSARPFCRFVTSTTLGSCKVLCAALTCVRSKVSPFAVDLPLNASPYHDAVPVSS